MKQVFPFVAIVLSICAVAACSNDEPASPGANAAPLAAAKSSGEETVAKIPILPGYKYYVGGPVMKRDQYGRYRIMKFNDEVQQPPSRGMIFGTRSDGDQLEYRVWGNGTLLAFHKGVMRDGLFWQQYAESYRSNKLTARERSEFIDAEKRSKVTIEDIDPEDGEVIRTRQYYASYIPPPKPDPDEEDEEGEEMERTNSGAPPAAAPPAGKPAAPAPAAPAKEGVH